MNVILPPRDCLIYYDVDGECGPTWVHCLYATTGDDEPVWLIKLDLTEINLERVIEYMEIPGCFVLILNDMRDPKIEMLTEVARARTKIELEDMLINESVDFYKDGQWSKTFRKGGPLEWFNKSYNECIVQII